MLKAHLSSDQPHARWSVAAWANSCFMGESSRRCGLFARDDTVEGSRSSRGLGLELKGGR